MDTADWIWLLVLMVWSSAAIGLMVQLRVFSPRVLRESPVRLSRLSLPMVFGVLVLYLVFAVAVQGAFYGFAGESPAGPATTTAPATATSPATTSATTVEAEPETGPATAPATTSASRPATPQVGGAEEVEPSLLERQMVDACQKLVPCVLILILARFMVVGGVSGLGLSWRKIGKGAALGFLGYLIIFPFLCILAPLAIQFFEWLHTETRSHQTLMAIRQAIPMWQTVGFVVLATVAAPVMEELFFRGFVQTVLVQSQETMFAGMAPRPGFRPGAAQRWMAIVLTSLFFAWVHESTHRPVIFLLSLAMGYVYERTGLLWAAMVLHMAFNGINVYFTLAG